MSYNGVAKWVMIDRSKKVNYENIGKYTFFIITITSIIITIMLYFMVRFSYTFIAIPIVVLFIVNMAICIYITNTAGKSLKRMLLYVKIDIDTNNGNINIKHDNMNIPISDTGLFVVCKSSPCSCILKSEHKILSQYIPDIVEEIPYEVYVECDQMFIDSMKKNSKIFFI